MIPVVGRLLPQLIRRGVGRFRAEIVRALVITEVRRLVQSDRTIIFGPWLGEVGFELLYWVPFLKWVINSTGLNPSRIVAFSRGGSASWYQDITTRYIDIFDLLTVEEFRAGNVQRRMELGEQKQVLNTLFDQEVVSSARTRAELSDALILHPSLMYRLMQAYWWSHVPLAWVTRHSVYQQVQLPDLPKELGLIPGEYVAVKFYANDCFSMGVTEQRYSSAVINEIASVCPVVSLTTDLSIDDHQNVEQRYPNVTTLAGRVTARNNLDVQTAVVGNAKAFIGTYGGFSYLAPLCGVPTIALYDDASRFDDSHLRVARAMVEKIQAPPFCARSMRTTSPTAVTSFVQGDKCD